jgi:hypothetical protein
MLIVETPVFTRRVLKLLSDDNYRFLQQTLVADPEAGDLIRHSGGLRKIRWSVAGRGSEAVFGLSITGLRLAKRSSCY